VGVMESKHRKKGKTTRHKFLKEKMGFKGKKKKKDTPPPPPAPQKTITYNT